MNLKKIEESTKTAQETLDFYSKLTGSEEDDALVDLLADLMHWSHKHSEFPFYFKDMIRKAEFHYNAERAPGRRK